MFVCIEHHPKLLWLGITTITVSLATGVCLLPYALPHAACSLEQQLQRLQLDGSEQQQAQDKQLQQLQAELVAAHFSAQEAGDAMASAAAVAASKAAEAEHRHQQHAAALQQQLDAAAVSRAQLESELQAVIQEAAAVRDRSSTNKQEADRQLADSRWQLGCAKQQLTDAQQALTAAKEQAELAAKQVSGEMRMLAAATLQRCNQPVSF